MVAKIKDTDVIMVENLLAGLREAGVERGSRNRTVAEKTGYSEKTVGNLLSGNSAITPRFLRAVCSAFNINISWVTDGLEPILISEQAAQVINAMLTTPMEGLRNKQDEVIQAWFVKHLTYEERYKIFKEVADKIASGATENEH